MITIKTAHIAVFLNYYYGNRIKWKNMKCYVALRT